MTSWSGQCPWGAPLATMAAVFGEAPISAAAAYQAQRSKGPRDSSLRRACSRVTLGPAEEKAPGSHCPWEPDPGRPHPRHPTKASRSFFSQPHLLLHFLQSSVVKPYKVPSPCLSYPESISGTKTAGRGGQETPVHTDADS